MLVRPKQAISILQARSPPSQTLPKRLCRPYKQQHLRKRATAAVSDALTTSISSTLSAQTVPADLPFVFAAFPYALPSFSIKAPSFFTVLGFLLAHPFVTLSLAVFLYVTIPRLWRAFVKYVVVPTAVLGAGIVVVRNPDSFRSAGIFVSNSFSIVLHSNRVASNIFNGNMEAMVGSVTSDHPYVTSAAILIALTLVLSPYVLTALLALFVATGVPRLPAPIRNFLPAPVLEIEQSIASFDSVVRGPINVAKEKATELGSGFTARSSSLLTSAQSNLFQSQQSEKAPALTERR